MGLVALVGIVLVIFAYRYGRLRICIYVDDMSSAKTDAMIYSPSSTALSTDIEDVGVDGGGNLRIETIYRGTNRVLMTTGMTNLSTRVYFCDNTPYFEERDENGDGIFEAVIIHSRYSPYGFEEFIREKDGGVKPLGENEYVRRKEKLIASGCSR